MMKMKKAALVAAVSLATVFGATQANAYVYSRSYLEVDNLQLGAIDVDATGARTPADVVIESYVNSTTNTSGLNGVEGTQTGGTCTLVTCPAVAAPGPVLDSGPSQLGSSYLNNDFASKGPSDLGLEFARADSVVHEAAIIAIRDGVDPAVAKTHTQQIAEAQLLSGADAKSSSLIQSTTGIELVFEVSGANAFFVNFTAVWDQLVDIDTSFFGPADTASAQSELALSVKLRKNGTSLAAAWTPGNDFGIDCFSNFGACNSVNAGDLNATVLTTGDPDTDANSGDGAFTFFVDGLTDGTWTLVLNGFASTLLTQTVPVPGTLAIFGLGLVSMGVAGRRRRSVQLAS